LFVVHGLDSQSLLVEEPGLCSSSISDLDSHVSVVDDIEISARSHVSNDMEWSFNIETEVFVEFSLNWISLPLIGIDDIELLIDLSVFLVGNDISVFRILSTLNIEDLTLLILDSNSSSVPHLPPS
jgi:hypothetical protein